MIDVSNGYLVWLQFNAGQPGGHVLNGRVHFQF